MGTVHPKGAPRSIGIGVQHGSLRNGSKNAFHIYFRILNAYREIPQAAVFDTPEFYLPSLDMLFVLLIYCTGVMNMEKKRDYTIDAAEKTLNILNVFDAEHRYLSFSQITEISGYSKSSEVRMLYTLQKNRFLSYDEQTGLYSLGPRIIRLGHLAQISVDVVRVSMPYLNKISNDYGLICYIGRRDGDLVQVLAKTYPSRLPGWAALMTTEGSTMPLYSTGIGKLFLSEMSDSEMLDYFHRTQMKQITDLTITDPQKLMETIKEVRKTHIAMNNAENELYIHSICVPVYNPRGEMIVGISFCGFAEIFNTIGRERLVETLKGIGQAISEQMGWSGE